MILHVADLAPGATFEVVGTELRGTVISHGMMGSRVKYNASRQVRIEVKARFKDEEDKVCEFTAPSGPIVIAGRTEVKRLSGNLLKNGTLVGEGQID